MSRKFVKRYWLVLLTIIPLLLSIGITNAQDQPFNVTIPGTLQSVLGCSGDWQPEGDCTALEFSEEDQVWAGTFEIPAGSYEYKVAIDESWTENYGGKADPGGPNVSLVLESDTAVTFIYDHATNWVADSVNHIIATVPGSFQSEIGCPGDWAPDCLRSWLQDPDGDGTYVFVTTAILAGEYEAKVALDQSWTLNYGDGGAQDGANIAFTVGQDYEQVTFSFDTGSNSLSISTDPSVVGEAPSTGTTSSPPAPVEVEQPEKVVIPGTIQSVAGCDGDWQPDGDCTALTLNETDLVWRGAFDIPAGSYFYKVAINGSWDENYGGSADAGGPDVVLNVPEDTTVRFYYDHATNWVADSLGDIIATAPGSYQSAIGCAGDWAPECMRSWLQDPDGDGVYSFSTSAIPAGDYEVKVALNESWDVNYGAEGTEGGANIPFSVPADGTRVTFAYNSSSNELTIGVGAAPTVGRVIRLTTDRQQAYWVSADTLAWDIDAPEGTSFALNYSSTAGIAGTPESLDASDFIELQLDEAGLSDDILAKFPHLEGLTTLKIVDADRALLQEILRSQIVISARDADGAYVGATGVQIPGALDELFTYDGDLGLTFDADGIPTIRVWAPTAQNVSFHLFDDSDSATESTVSPMEYDPETGVWTITGASDWAGKFYLFEVQVYAPSVQAIVNNVVTDPYSLSLSTNSARSQIVDLASADLAPEGWAELSKPELAAPEDIVLYELHVRDFSISDESVSEALRGTFAAFTQTESNGMQHLIALANAGLTHIHLLPAFDIATINENADERTEPSFEELAALPGDSIAQSDLIDPIRDEDGFNWGYDPLHYTVPEGSYSTNPDGPQRIIEFRSMVQTLNSNGLRVVMDVVYNHTNAAGQSDRSVLDRIVPGYYHRLDRNGSVATSTCCQNTATEHNMMRKLMVDSVVTWATAYKVDGFRFDLMGHHMLADMVAVREALDSLTLEADGVDGASIYVYGEGWNFGEVADNVRGINATQLNIGGTGIGVFNDRLRDAVRGGSPVQGETIQHQGVASGLYFAPNGITPGDETTQLDRLLLFSDQIRVGLAGNLADYTFEGYEGEAVTGAEVSYNGSPAGYTNDPQENIVYAAAHDNETLWDMVQLKAPLDASIADRIRMNNMAISYVGFSQGIPFFHAGDELLRSKSLDRDSYNSGDWFNRLDFTYQTNNWAVGIPPTRRDLQDLIGGILANPDLNVTPDDIQKSLNHMREILAIRSSSPLFRLQTAEEINRRLFFLNTGPDQIPGLIAMALYDVVGEDLDPNHSMIVVLFNASPDEVSVSSEALMDSVFVLHPVQASSFDPVVRTAQYADGVFTVPGRTTAVFVVPQN